VRIFRIAAVFIFFSIIVFMRRGVLIIEEHPYIVLFDGECNLCDSLVQFTIKRDRRGELRYAALQSETGQRLIQHYGLTDSAGDTFIFIARGRAYVRSTAALRLLRHLSGGWPVLSLFVIIPAFLRDPLYRYVAKNRYRWFGKKQHCMLMKPEYRERFYT